MEVKANMAPTRVQGVGVEELKHRAARAANDLEAHRQLFQAKAELRDQAVLELYEAHVPIKEISATAHLSPSRVIQIIARRG